MPNPILPRDNHDDTIQLTINTQSLASTYNLTISADTEVALQTKTSLIEVTALSQGILIKWKTATGGTAVSTTNFDDFVVANTTRHFVRPFVSGVLATHVSFIQQAATGNLICIEK